MTYAELFQHASPSRPTVLSPKGGIATGHYLATAAAARVLAGGGNAVDAGVAAGLCLNVVHNDMCTLTGVAPIMLYSAKQKKVFSIDGVGTYGRGVDLEQLRRKYPDRRIDWPDNTVVPAALDAWITALRDHGTLTFQEVVEPALEYAEEGYPVGVFQRYAITEFLETYRRWEENRSIFLRGNEPPAVGERIVQKDLSRSLRRLIDAEMKERGHGREAALNAVRDCFYRGPLGDELAGFAAEVGSPLTREDFAAYQVRYEQPYQVPFKGLSVYGCGPWSQGPVLLQALRFLQACDPSFEAREAAETVHLMVECLKMAFWDRFAYYGDPRFTEVPMAELLSEEYALRRVREIDPGAAHESPDAGNVPRGRSPGKRDGLSDTSYVAVMDQLGNIFSATPSDGYSQGGICPGLGLHLSERGGQGALEADNPNSVRPLKRPRLTPNPSLVLKDGRPYMALGTPGNDRQAQAMLQVLLNLEVYQMEPQLAVEAPRFATYSFPASTHPRTVFPNVLQIEGAYPAEVVEGLQHRGHSVKKWSFRHWQAGGVCLVRFDERRGIFESAADHRRDGYALGL